MFHERLTPSRIELIAAARAHAHALVEHLQTLASLEPSEQQAPWQEYVSLIREAVHFVECAGPSRDRHELDFTSAQLRAFAKLLRDKRSAANLTRAELGRKAGLSSSTIRDHEMGRRPPSRATLLRLTEVPELKLSWADLPTGQPAPAASRAAEGENTDLVVARNFYVPPNYDPVRMVVELGQFLNGSGGHVEQTGAYLDHQSAVHYLAMCHQGRPAAFRAQVPLEAIAKRLVDYTGQVDLSVIALGVGDGTQETRLVQGLHDLLPRRSIELCLFDISQPLLNVAFKHAADTFPEGSGLHMWAMQGNFHHLPLYSQLHYRPPHSKRRRVYCMLGNTMANVDNEPRFFRDSLVGSPGDYLVLDTAMACAPPERPELIKERDPTWSNGVSAAHATWLGGPIWRHCKDVESVDFSWRLDTACLVPGSYALEAIATVRVRSRAVRQFSMFRFKRYDHAQLAECLANLGWEQLAMLPFGEPRPLVALMLFCKRGQAE